MFSSFSRCFARPSVNENWGHDEGAVVPYRAPVAPDLSTAVVPYCAPVAPDLSTAVVPYCAPVAPDMIEIDLSTARPSSRQQFEFAIEMSDPNFHNAMCVYVTSHSCISWVKANLAVKSAMQIYSCSNRSDETSRLCRVTGRYRASSCRLFQMVEAWPEPPRVLDVALLAVRIANEDRCSAESLRVFLTPLAIK
jgi:hypothetical protein